VSGGLAVPLIQVAQRLRAEAREHKRMETYHRRRARELMQQLEELREVCRRLGIELVMAEPGGRADDWQRR
jgi:hypothetical protein